MSTPVRVVAFLAVLVVAFAASWGIGSAVGPREVEVAPEHTSEHTSEHTEATPGEGHGGHGAGGQDDSAAEVGGLAVSQDGYTLMLDEPVTVPGRRQVRFTITGPDGHPLEDYEVEHEQELHLVAVRRDLTGFQHVHPRRDADGVWSADLGLRPGSWRLFADFVPAGGAGLTLGADLGVAGPQRPAGPVPERRVDRVDGYEVELRGDAVAGEPTVLTARVTRHGRPVTDLQPYLGAYGHLVALRAGDLAYLHVHPQDGPAGPDVAFDTALPTAGDYRLFLDFRHGGRVRTAEFALTAPGARHDH